MGLISNVASNLAVKKLNGKTHTQANYVLAQEVIGSNVQIGSNIIFGLTPPNNPSTTLYATSSVNGSPVVEYIEFDLVPIPGTSYTATTNTTGDGNPAGVAQFHGFALKFPSDYETNSDNPKAGTGYFVNNGYLTGSLGAVQLVPVNFSTVSPNPYQPILYNINGTLLNQATDPQDWIVDTYAGTFFVQDPDANMYNVSTPTVYSKLRAFVYIGTFLSETIGGTSTQADSAASASVSAAVDNNPYYITFVSQSSGTHPFKVDIDLTYNPSTNILTTTASWAQNALTASNITKAFITGTPAADGQIVISKGTGQVTGSSLLSYSDSNNGQLTIGGATDGVSINPSNFTVNSNTFNYVFGNTPYNGIVFSGLDNQGTATVTFNISASFTGPSTFANANNSTFDDQFILLASGSSAAGGDKDSGIVFEYGNTLGSGSALFFDTNNSKRLSFRYSASVSNTAMTPTAYVNMTFKSGVDGISNTSDVDTRFANAGGGDESDGFMFIDAQGNIYIKA
jgi:hypothetical protein